MSVTLKDVGSGFKRTAINQNFTDIESEINNNLLNKDGSTALESDLDFNSNRAINLADGVFGTDGVNLNQLNAIVSGAGGLSSIAQARETQLGSQAVANVFTLTGITYAVGTNTLSVYRNGQRLEKTIDYTETTASSVTLTFPPNSTDRFVFITNDLSTSEVTTTSAITHTEDGTDYNLATYLSNREANTVAELKTLSPEVGERIVTKGYYTAGDGGHATYIVAAPQAVDGYGDHLLANGNVALLREAIPDVKQYGAVPDGNTAKTDNTLAITAFIAAVGNGAGTFSEGRYAVTTLDFNVPGNFTCHNLGFVGIATSATDAVVKITKNDCKFFGTLFINGDYNTNYSSGLKISTPTAATQFIDIEVLKVQNVLTGIWYGDNSETAHTLSENTVGIYATLGVERAIYCERGILFINGGAFGSSLGAWDINNPGQFDASRGRVIESIGGNIVVSNATANATESGLGRGFDISGGGLTWVGGAWEIVGPNLYLQNTEVNVVGVSFAVFTSLTNPFIELVDGSSGYLRIANLRISANNKADALIQTNSTPDWKVDFVNLKIERANRLQLVKSSGANNTYDTEISWTNVRVAESTQGDYILNSVNANMIDVIRPDSTADLNEQWWLDGSAVVSLDTVDVPVNPGRAYPYSIEVDGTGADGALHTIDRTSVATRRGTGLRVQASELYLVEGWFKYSGAGSARMQMIQYDRNYNLTAGTNLIDSTGLMDTSWKYISAIVKMENDTEFVGVGGRAIDSVCNFMDLKLKRIT